MLSVTWLIHQHHSTSPTLTLPLLSFHYITFTPRLPLCSSAVTPTFKLLCLLSYMATAGCNSIPQSTTTPMWLPLPCWNYYASTLMPQLPTHNSRNSGMSISPATLEYWSVPQLWNVRHSRNSGLFASPATLKRPSVPWLIWLNCLINGFRGNSPFQFWICPTVSTSWGGATSICHSPMY